MNTETTEKTYTKAELDKAVNAEKERIQVLLLKNQADMVAEYGLLIKHTGGLVAGSMKFAYAKGLNDAFKLLSKGEK